MAKERGPGQAAGRAWRRWLLPLLILVTGSALTPGARAQSLNDNLDQRLVLQLGEPVESQTDGCTVQWGCVDEKLTGKCIDYHNDQWFAFRPVRAGRYYVNIGGQRCRDIRGVQLVVLTAGEPCNPATYQILSCTSLGTQDDVFVPLEIPAARPEILLNVDGYLHDYCRFQLAVDTVARGVPAQPAPVFPAKMEGTSPYVAMTWLLPDSLAGVSAFRVLRREAARFRAEEVARVPVARNAAGGFQSTYTLVDTLPGPGRYAYQIVATGEAGREPVVVHRQLAGWSRAAARTAAPHVKVPLDRYPANAELSVVVSDARTGRLLRRAQLVRKKGIPAEAVLPTGDLVRQGIEAVRVIVTYAGRRGSGPVTDELELPLL